MMGRLLGLARSAVVYRRPGRQRGLRRFYAAFVSPGDLVFDVGAHLGDRTAAFAALGARVVAVEPQPDFARWLRRLDGRRGSVTVREEAAGPRVGRAQLATSGRHPPLATVAHGWRARIGQANPSFRTVRWDQTIEVPMTTLDRLIEEHGVPSFCKIDVEGYEADVLAGLSHAVGALSVEFVQGSLEIALACIERLTELGPWEYNAVLGERRDFVFSSWQAPAAIRGWVAAGAQGASSGDLYARSLSTTTPLETA
jgi:FkbM family methyltransferase